MDSVLLDNVKVEKAKAIARFNQFRKITKLLQLLEVILAVILIFWSSARLPAAVKHSGGYIYEVSVHLFNHHVVFLFGNAIIVAIFVLCRQSDVGVNSGIVDTHDDYVRHSEVQGRVVSSPVLAPQAGVPEENNCSSVEDKGIVRSEAAVARIENDAMTTAIEKATKQIRKFQRTQSEKLKREIAVKPGRELRKSKTESHRELFCAREKQMETSSKTVDALSNEEFQHIVDAFIKERQEFFKRQRLAEQMSEATVKNA